MQWLCVYRLYYFVYELFVDIVIICDDFKLFLTIDTSQNNLHASNKNEEVV